jgi:shikimate kinase
MQENGYVIYLKADTDVLYNRVKDSTNRPLLHGDDVYGKFTAIFYKRQSLYENVAHYIVDTSFLLAEQVVDEILDVLDKGEGSF